MTPLDTKPLNRSRKALLLLFMLVLFIGSLGVARLIVKERTRTVSKGFFFDIPAGYETFQVVQQTPHVPVIACSTTKGDRQFIVFQLPFRGVLRQIDLVDHAQIIYETYLHASPEAHANTRINRYPATELSGPVGGGFGIITVTAAEGRIVAVLYHGTSAPSDADKKLFRQLTEESITFFGQQNRIK